MPPGDLPVLGFGDQGAWESWLARQHAVSPGIWLKIPKKGSGGSGLSYADALAVALCLRLDRRPEGPARRRLLAAALRPAQAGQPLVEDQHREGRGLIEAGRMRPPGMREVELARADGRWDAAYAGQRAMAVPDDLAAELARNERRPRVLRDPVQREPVRDPVPDRRRQAAGDPGPADRPSTWPCWPRTRRSTRRPDHPMAGRPALPEPAEGGCADSRRRVGPPRVPA